MKKKSTLASILLEALFEMFGSFIGAIAFILMIAIPVGAMFGIAWLVDTYSKWYLLLYILFFFLFSLVGVLIERSK